MNKLKLRHMLEGFLLEDIGEGDMTSQSIFPSTEKGTGTFIAKESGVIAGLDIIQEAYTLLDPSIIVTPHIHDGEEVVKGDVIAEVTGSIAHILTGERVILNLLQRMSGIATMTKRSVEALDDDSIQICDTRKTTPGLRMLEKYAVRAGGGKNHRIGLYDGVMIKDNHIAFAGSIAKAVTAVRKHTGHMVKVEVETENERQVEEAVTAKADIIMFDNRTPNEIKDLAQLVPSQIITEASGGITIDRLPSFKGSGVDYISLGYLTHSVRALDISLVVE